MWDNDDRYLKILLDRLEVCNSYVPKFGHGRGGVSLTEFYSIYGSDPFYSWFGLNKSIVYSAHRVAGGITSIYRQIGIGCEELFRQIIRDHLGLTDQQVNWSYEITTAQGVSRTLKLDGRIIPSDVIDSLRRERVSAWIQRVAVQLQLDDSVARAMKGIVFEIRQGYKSKDSKRQNADMANAAQAYTKGYLPVLLVMSNQIDEDIVERYARGKWLVLRGINEINDLSSTYAFSKEIIGFDLAGFFDRNSPQLKKTTENVILNLIREDGDKTAGRLNV